MLVAPLPNVQFHETAPVLMSVKVALRVPQALEGAMEKEGAGEGTTLTTPKAVSAHEPGAPGMRVISLTVYVPGVL